MNDNPFNVAVRLLKEFAAPVFWVSTVAPLEDASEFVVDGSRLVTTALELEIAFIDVMAPVTVALDLLESALLVASAEPSFEPWNGGERRSEVIAGIDADAIAVFITGEDVSEVAAPVTEPAVISTR